MRCYPNDSIPECTQMLCWQVRSRLVERRFVLTRRTLVATSLEAATGCKSSHQRCLSLQCWQSQLTRRLPMPNKKITWCPLVVVGFTKAKWSTSSKGRYVRDHCSKTTSWEHKRDEVQAKCYKQESGEVWKWPEVARREGSKWICRARSRLAVGTI